MISRPRASGFCLEFRGLGLLGLKSLYDPYRVPRVPLKGTRRAPLRDL